MKWMRILVILVVLFPVSSSALTMVDNNNGTFTLILETDEEKELVRRVQTLYGQDILKEVFTVWFDRKMRSFNYIDAELQKRQFDALTSKQKAMIEKQLRSTGVK